MDSQSRTRIHSKRHVEAKNLYTFRAEDRRLRISADSYFFFPSQLQVPDNIRSPREFSRTMAELRNLYVVFLDSHVTDIQRNALRRDRNFRTGVDLDDSGSGETLAYRESVLKKWSQSALYLSAQDGKAANRAAL